MKRLFAPMLIVFLVLSFLPSIEFVHLSHASSTYVVYFTEQGVSPVAGYQWSVTFNGVTEYSGSTSPTFYTIEFDSVPDGTNYAFSVQWVQPAGLFVPTPSSGNVPVSGSDKTVTITFNQAPPPTYSVTIGAYCNTESASVSVAIKEDGSSTGFYTSHTFTSLSGSHTFSVPSNDPSGHPFTQWSTGQTSTTITVSSAGTYTAYYQATTYTATIGAHDNTVGGDVSVAVTEDGSSSGYSTPHAFSGLSGSHTFAVPSTDPSGHPFTQWSTGQTSTTITVSSAGTYTAHYEASGQTYNVFFSQSGLPNAPWAVWSAVLNGQTESSSSSGNNVYTITFANEPNGQYSYTITPPSGYTTSSYPPSPIIVDGSDKTIQVSFSPLSASASATPTNGFVPLSVQFNGSASGGLSPYTYSWDFGDGSPSSNQQNPFHIYQNAGVYTATFSVSDVAGDIATSTVTVTAVQCSVELTSTNGGSIAYSSSYGSGTIASGQSSKLQVPSGTQITLTADPNSTHVFQSWSTTGSVSVSDPSSTSTTATAEGNGDVTANFAAKPMLKVLSYWTSPGILRQGQQFSIDIQVENPSQSTLQSPTYLQVQTMVPAKDAYGQPPAFVATLVGPADVGPDETIVLAYQAVATWYYAAPPNFLDSLSKSYLQLGIDALLTGLVGKGTSAYENFLLQHFFTLPGGQTQLTYWIVKDGIERNVFFSGVLIETIKGIEEVTPIQYLFANGGVTNGIWPTFAFPTMNYPIDYSNLPSGAMSVFIYPTAYKIATAEQAQSAEREAMLVSAGLAIASAATLWLGITGAGCIVPGALLAGSILVSTCTEAWYQSQMADPSLDYTEYVVVQPPPQSITLLLNQNYGKLIYDEYMAIVLMNASVESNGRAFGAMNANASDYAYAQESLAERYAANATYYWQDLMTGLNTLITHLCSTDSINETSFLEGQNELASEGLPQNVSLLLQAMNLLSYVNLTQLESYAYSPINATATVSISSAPSNIEMDDELILSQNPLARHDVAIINVTPCLSWTYQNFPIMVNVTAVNLGDFTENTTISLCYNGTTENGNVGNEAVLLLPNETETLTFAWNTTGVPICCDGYNITASVDISPEIDSNMTNNFLQSAVTIQIRILGDINGDGKVDGKDIALTALAFGTVPGDPRWNPNADMNQDGKIDGKDIVLVARKFGTGLSI